MSSIAGPRAWAFPIALVRAVPVAAWLAGLVAASAVVRFALGRRMPAPWIMVDELVYSELARGIASGAGFVLRGESVGLGYGVVYPVLIAPAYVVDSLPDAYAVAKGINAVVISLAAVPAYLLARRLVSAPYALLVAVLAVAVPSLAYAGTLMTENAFYPLFLTAVLAFVLALERPTPLRVAVLLGVVGIAYLTRAQAIAFVPAILTAPLLIGRLREYRWLYGGLAGAAGLVLAGATLLGTGPGAVLGAYRSVSDRDYDVGEIARWLLYHAGELDLYVGVAPFAALLLLVARGRSLERRHRAFAAAAAAISLWLLLQVATFASLPFVQRIEERNLFYLAPLFFAALAFWLERGIPRQRLLAVGAGAVAVALPAFVPYERLTNINAVSDTLALLPLWRLAELWNFPLGRIWIVVVAGGAVLAALLLFLPRQALVALPIALLALYGLAAQPVDARMVSASAGAQFQGFRSTERAWVDRALGRRADVATLWTGVRDPMTVFENELFSRSVRDVHYLHAPLPGGLPQQGVGIDPADGVLRPEITAPYLLTDDSLPLEGQVVATLEGMRVLRLDGPARVTGITSGVYSDLWTAPTFSYRGFRCDGGVLRVTLGSDVRLFSRPQRVVAYVDGRVAARGTVRPEVEETVLTVPLDPDAEGVCLVRFRVLDTGVPTTGDVRRLGIRVLRLDRA